MEGDVVSGVVEGDVVITMKNTCEKNERRRKKKKKWKAKNEENKKWSVDGGSDVVWWRGMW